MKLALLFLIALVMVALIVSTAQDESSPNPDASAEEVQFEQADGEGEVEGPPSRLLEASGQGDLQGIEEAINNGEDIGVLNVNGWSAAMFAVAGNQIDALRVLIDANININHPSNDGITPLMLAASQGNKEIVELLLMHGADPSVVSEDGSSAYSIAAASGRRVVEMILAEANLQHAISNGLEDDIIRSIQDGAPVDLRAGGGWTALIYATSVGNTQLAESLLKLDANPNVAENDGWTPLHFAAHNGFVEIVKLLLERGADAEVINDNGSSPRELADAANHGEVLDLLPVPEQDL